MVFTYSADKYSEEETKKNFEKKQHEKAFKRLRDQVAKFNGKVFILYCPTKANAYTEYYNIPELLSRKYEDYFRGLIQDTCTEFGFKFIDLQPFIKRHADQGEVLFWTDDTHIDNKGHELLADIVQDSVKGE